MRKWKERLLGNKNRFYFGILILILLMLIVWSSYSALNVGKQEEVCRISVIVNDSNSDRWTALREGLEQAAENNQVELNVVATGNMTTVEEERKLALRELDNGAKGIILQPISSTKSAELVQEISQRAAVMLLENEIEAPENYAIAEPDNTAIGKAVAQAVTEDFSGDLSGKRIGILCGDVGQYAMKQRLEGFLSVIGESEAVIAWTFGGEVEDIGSRLAGSSSVDIMVALGNDELEQAVDYAEQNAGNKKKCLIYGEGCSQKNVYYLDKGCIRFLAVPNEFNMGYCSVAEMAEQLKFRVPQMERVTIDFLSINRENLYEEENQRILFPIVQ